MLPAKPGMSCAIAVMAKAPHPGRCKTRLIPRVSPLQAAELSAAFLRDVTANVQAAASDGTVVGFVAYAPAGAAGRFDGMLAPGTGLLLADGAIDCPSNVQGFGRCLLHAVQTLLADGHQAVCVLNADSPTLPTDYLRQAAAVLAEGGDRVVLGPAEDGGYYLLGMTQAHAGLFADIDWSTPRVCAQTIARASALGLELVMLPPWYDVDEPASLDRLRSDVAGGGVALAYDAPATKTALARIYAEALCS
jgi:rSAM/selenodomain-associated transferase 1